MPEGGVEKKVEKFKKVIDRVSYFYILQNVKHTYGTIDVWEG